MYSHRPMCFLRPFPVLSTVHARSSSSCPFVLAHSRARTLSAASSSASHAPAFSCGVTRPHFPALAFFFSGPPPPPSSSPASSSSSSSSPPPPVAPVPFRSGNMPGPMPFGGASRTASTARGSPASRKRFSRRLRKPLCGPRSIPRSCSICRRIALLVTTSRSAVARISAIRKVRRSEGRTASTGTPSGSRPAAAGREGPARSASRASGASRGRFPPLSFFFFLPPSLSFFFDLAFFPLSFFLAFLPPPGPSPAPAPTSAR